MFNSEVKTKIRKELDNGRIAVCVQILIVVSLISFSLDTLPDISETGSKVLFLIKIITIGLFTVEYFLRIIISEKPFKFITSWWGIIDLLAIFPYYLGAYMGVAMDLRYVRILRLFRLVYILKMFRRSSALKRIARALALARDELIFFIGASLIILYVSSVGIYYFENPVQPDNFKSIPHSLWWSVITLTTVGYGDVYPITMGGKIFTGFIVFIGLGFVAMPASIMTAALSQARREEKEKAVESANKKRIK
ncbi:MAG: ion transporter [Rickettsiales bacterium]